MTDEIIEDQSGGWRGKFSLFALLFAIFGVAWFAAAALGTKYGFWSWQFGLVKMTIGWGPIIVIATAGVSILACVFAFIKSPRKRPAMLAIAAVLMSGLLAGRLAGLGAGAQAVPPIHDIQTSWSDPVELTRELLAARGPDANPVLYRDEARFPDLGRAEYQQYVGRLISDIQEEAECETDGKDACEEGPPKPYAPIKPLFIKASPEKVFMEALALVEARGWDVVTADPLKGVIEATHTSAWWGFKDDVAIRLRGQNDGTMRIDMRSTSRVGVSDLGANAHRVTAFLYDLEGQRYD